MAAGAKKSLTVAALALAATGCASRSSAPRNPNVAFAFAGTTAPPEDPTHTPAFQYANMGREACLAELGRRKIAWTPVPEARAVLAPVRLGGPLRGIDIHSVLPAKQRATSPLEILDCRLVLALDDFAQLVSRYDVVEIVHMSVYRPPPKKAWPDGRIGRRHDGALAIDIGKFIRKDGTVLDVEKDFHGRIGTRTCGPNTGPAPATPEAVALRSMVCDAADARLFTVELTPDFNWQHRNHFHMEVTANVKWFLVH
jgi:hypothetical protein